MLAGTRVRSYGHHVLNFIAEFQDVTVDFLQGSMKVKRFHILSPMRLRHTAIGTQQKYATALSVFHLEALITCKELVDAMLTHVLQVLL